MWNYRIIKREVEGQPDQYGLFEVFYNDEGKIRLMLDDAQKSYYEILKYDKIDFAPLYDESEKNETIELCELYGDEGEIKETD